MNNTLYEKVLCKNAQDFSWLITVFLYFAGSKFNMVLFEEIAPFAIRSPIRVYIVHIVHCGDAVGFAAPEFI